MAWWCAFIYSLLLWGAGPTPAEFEISIGSWGYETLSFVRETGGTRTLMLSNEVGVIARKSFSSAQYEKWLNKFRTTAGKAQTPVVFHCQSRIRVKESGAEKEFCLDRERRLDEELGKLWLELKGVMK